MYANRYKGSSYEPAWVELMRGHPRSGQRGASLVRDDLCQSVGPDLSAVHDGGPDYGLEDPKLVLWQKCTTLVQLRI